MPDPGRHAVVSAGPMAGRRVGTAAAGELLGRRQDMATNQLLSHALEQLLIRSKRERDTEAANMNMRLLGMRNRPPNGDPLVQGAANDLRTWRQP